MSAWKPQLEDDSVGKIDRKGALGPEKMIVEELSWSLSEKPSE